MQTMRIFEGNGWFIQYYDAAANRSFVDGPGRIGPVPWDETEKHIEYYRARGIAIEDNRKKES